MNFVSYMYRYYIISGGAYFRDVGGLLVSRIPKLSRHGLFGTL